MKVNMRKRKMRAQNQEYTFLLVIQAVGNIKATLAKKTLAIGYGPYLPGKGFCVFPCEPRGYGYCVVCRCGTIYSLSFLSIFTPHGKTMKLPNEKREVNQGKRTLRHTLQVKSRPQYSYNSKMLCGE